MTGAQLHKRCRVSTAKLCDVLPRYGKKWFAQADLRCTFCSGKGHENYFCPAAPYRPENKSDRNPFVEKLLALPQVKTNKFLGRSWQEVVEDISQDGETWNVGNPWEGSEFIYDRLRARLGFWKAIGASDSVISWLGYGVPMKFVSPPPFLAFDNHKMEPEAKAYVTQDMAKHVASGCFKKAPAGSVRISNPILCIKQGCKHRRCDDCRHGNSYQASPKFKMDGLKENVPPLVEVGDVQIVRDLEKAYYKVPLAPAAQPYAAFKWEGAYFFSMVMLFGMCQAPFFFTKICRPIARLFGCVKLPAVSFIDDWWWSVKKSLQEGAIGFIKIIFGLLGWSFNNKGQEGIATTFLGFIIDSVRREFIVPAAKISIMSDLIRELQLSSAAKIRVRTSTLHTLVGKVISVSLAIPGVSTWCRSLYRLLQPEQAWAWLNKSAQEELGVLLTLLTFHNGSPFLDPLTDISMWVDSGEIGWGAHLQEIISRGHFPEWAIGTSSTARELLGLLLALKSDIVSSRIRGKVVLLHMDSMCSVRNLVKGGGPVDELVYWIKEIWKVCRDLGVTLSPRWQRRDVFDMQKADDLSKMGTEWELLESFILEVYDRYGIMATMPDLARCGPTLIATVSRSVTAAIVLPRWEAKTWWAFAVEHCRDKIQLGDMRGVVAPNSSVGYPRWDFYLFLF